MNGLEKIKNAEIKLFTPVLRFVVFFWFWISRWIIHNLFLFRLNNPKLPPSLISIPFVYASLALIILKREFQILFTQYALNKYTIFILKHYSVSGFGYFDYGNLSDSQRQDIYTEQRGRLSYYIENAKFLIPYKNGDTFLDAGCGRGQNIKELVKCYPKSKIKGFDISDQALKVIKCGSGNNPNIEVEVGDIGDFEFLRSYSDASVDHVIMSHVFTFLVRSNIDETVDYRQQIIDNLVRISSSSVIILDKIEDIPNLRVEIEQNTRCIVHDRIMNYFSKYIDSGQGEIYVLFSKEDAALLYLKKKLEV